MATARKRQRTIRVSSYTRKPPAPRKELALAQPKAPQLPPELEGEISFTSSTLYRYRPTPYNPDDLVGKKGLPIYRTMTTDEQVKAAMSLANYAVLSTGFDVVPPDAEDEEDKAIGKEMADFVMFNFEEMEGSFDSKLEEVLTARTYGFSVSEKVFYLIDYGPWSGKVGLKGIKTRQPFNIDFDVDPHGNLLDDGVLQNRSTRMPKDKFVIYSYRRTFDNYYGNSELRQAYRSWWSKDNTLRFMMITLERYGEPIIIATHEMRLTADQKSDLDSFAANLQNRSFVRLPKGITLDFKSPEVRAGTTFIPVLDALDTRIRVALLMPGLMGLSSEAPVGSFARSQTEFDAFILIVEKIRRDLETIFDEQVIKQLIDLNYEVTEGKYPRFRFREMTPAVKAQLLEMWLKAVQTGGFTKTREDENKARGLIDFPKLPDDVPMAGGTPTPTGAPGELPPELAGLFEKWAEKKSFHLPGQHDQCDHSPTGACSGELLQRTEDEENAFRSHLNTAEWTDGLSKEEEGIVRGYTNGLGEPMNVYLRKGDAGDTPVADIKLAISRLDAALAKTKTTVPVTIYRGLFGSPQKLGLKPGMIFVDKGYVSASRMKSAAERFVHKSTEGFTLVDIRLPKGSRAAYVSDLSVYPSENEVILPRSTKFKVVKMEQRGGLSFLTMSVMK